MAWSSSAGAQVNVTQAHALNRYEPSERGSNWFAADSLDLQGTFRPGIVAIGDFAYKPYILKNPDGSENTAIIRSQYYVHVGAAAIIASRLRIALSLPIAIAQDGDDKSASGNLYQAPHGGGIGDLRIAADVRLTGAYEGAATIALGGRVWVPTGKTTQFVGDGQLRIGPRLSLAMRTNTFAYALNVGAVYRANDTPFDGHPTGTEVNFNAAAGILLVDKRVLIGPEIFGSTVTSGNAFLGDHTTPLALIIGGHYESGDIRFGLGAGPGLSDAAGTAAFRGLASIEWMSRIEQVPSDRQHEERHEEACPDSPGVRTGEPGIYDCSPIAANRDHDSVPDGEDACPDVPGVRTEDRKTNGCPSDRDKDGISDKDDACPDVPGPGSADPNNNGCGLARIESGQVKITEQIRFKTNSDEIIESQHIIDAVANILKNHPEIKRLRIQGHTDNVAESAYNLELSRRRAASVMAALVKAGVAKDVLRSEGFGLEKPIADNSTEEGRAANRRVEFLIDHSEP